MLEGIDVSAYQGAIDWRAVARAGKKFAFIRVSDGAAYTDPRFASNWAGARAAGLTRGAYQFFRPTESPLAQADSCSLPRWDGGTVTSLPRSTSKRSAPHLPRNAQVVRRPPRSPMPSVLGSTGSHARPA